MSSWHLCTALVAPTRGPTRPPLWTHSCWLLFIYYGTSCESPSGVQQKVGDTVKAWPDCPCLLKDSPVLPVLISPILFPRLNHTSSPASNISWKVDLGPQCLLGLLLPSCSWPRILQPRGL